LTSKQGDHPEFTDPIILTKMRKGCTIESLCKSVHKDFADEFKYAMVWGRSTKFSPQTCGLGKFLTLPRMLTNLVHPLMDEDVIQIFACSKSKTGKILKQAKPKKEDKKAGDKKKKK
jgi:ribosome-interacting GTPase 1